MSDSTLMDALMRIYKINATWLQKDGNGRMSTLDVDIPQVEATIFMHGRGVIAIIKYGTSALGM